MRLAHLGIAFAFCIVTGAEARDRTTQDMPDDLTGYQVHIIYVLPSDGTDRQLDTNGTLEASVAAFRNWLTAQTGGTTLRLDTYQGVLDITFVQLSRTDAQIRAAGAFVRDLLEAELVVLGYTNPSKIYAVYYDGGSNTACGGGAWPPELAGNVAAMYLHGTPPGAPRCDSNAFATDPSSPGYLEFAMVHEIMHTQGFVSRCAPHFTAEGHVSDDPRDLMYAGPLAWQPSILDVGRDDYFQHGIQGCLDLALSAFMTPSAAEAVAPPGWPYSELSSVGCDQEPSLASIEAVTPSPIKFANGTSQPINIFWLDYNGQRRRGSGGGGVCRRFLALGAGRVRLARHMLIESLVLAWLIACSTLANLLTPTAQPWRRDRPNLRSKLRQSSTLPSSGSSRGVRTLSVCPRNPEASSKRHQ
jgi:hypothetical protein